MRPRGPHALFRTVVLILTFALATSGFAHRLSAAPDLQAEAARLYAAVYGLDAEDLCAGGDLHDHGSGCDACRLMASFSFPPHATGLIRLPLVPMRAVLVQAPQSVTSRLFSTPGTARAPPAA